MLHSPGQRLLIRDAEWFLKRVETTPQGETALVVQGVSEIVRGREAIFLPRAESSIRILDPSETRLVGDDSAGFLKTRLHLESQLRSTPPVGNDLWIGHRGAMDVLPFQLEPASQALARPRQRILIADTVGLGKTLEAGILTAELARRGRAKRILVVTMKSLLAQFQREWWSRFTIPLVRLDSVGLQRVRNRLPTHANPFHYYDRSIISLDTLRQDNEFRNHLEHAWWDVIVIDEAHNVARRGTRSLRHDVADLLSRRSDTLVLLSATPHDGRKTSFASLMNMLDPTAIADPENYGPEDIQGLYVRRFRKDVIDDLRTNVPERIMRGVKVPASAAEEVVFQRLQSLRLSSDKRSDESGKVASGLFRTTLLKSFLSSPQACRKTVSNRIDRIGKGDVKGTEDDLSQLRALLAAVDAMTDSDFSKYGALLAELKAWKASARDRLVIFTERLDTLHWLREALSRDLKLKDDAVAILHGELPDTEIMEIVEAFGQEDSKLRLLLASDVASEGINLHYQCHRMVHFDMPWSLMVFAQRNGRIDRYGQKEQPEIAYLLTCSASARSDERVMELLLQKDAQARESIGDPSVLLGVYTQEEQEEQVAQAIETGAQALETSFEDEVDPFEFFLNPGLSGRPTGAARMDLPSLFPSDYHYAATALRWLKEKEGDTLQFTLHERVREIELTIHKDLDTDDLASRFAFLPSEIVPDKGILHLASSAETVKESIDAARRSGGGTWPRTQYLWPLHPVMEWLDDRVQGAFGRHEAPVLPVPGLASNEVVVLVSGTVPNRLGHPLVHAWLGSLFRNGSWVENWERERVVATCGLDRSDLVYSAPIPPERLKSLEALLKVCLGQVATPFQELRHKRMGEHKAELHAQTTRLKELLERHNQQIELDFSKGLQQVVSGRKELRRRQVDDAFKAHEQWLRDAYHLEEHVHCTVLAVCIGA